MIEAQQIVKRLLEQDEDDLSPADLVRRVGDQVQAEKDQVRRDYLAGKVTAETVLIATEFYSRNHYYSRRGKETNEPKRVRKNGSVKLWKTRPGEFKVPVKYGMYEYFYITHVNAHEWSTQAHPEPESDQPKHS